MTKKDRSFARYANQFDLLQKKKNPEEEKQEQEVETKQEEAQTDLKPEEPKPEEKEKDHQPEPEPVDDRKEEKPGIEPEIDELDYLAELKKKPAKIKETFEIEPELHKELKSFARKYGYGFKTKFINSAIRRELDRIKKLEKRK